MLGRLVRCPVCKTENFIVSEEEANAEADSAPPASTEEPVAASELQNVETQAVIPSDDDDEQGLTFRSPQTEFDEMDLTPMVDVTFLLLIFFMITASFTLQKTIQFPPPDPDEQGATQTIQTIEDLLSKSIKVDIDERNNIYINDDPKPTSVDSLIETLRERMRTDLTSEMVLFVNPRTVHETVVTVIDAATEVGMQKVRLVDTRGEG